MIKRIIFFIYLLLGFRLIASELFFEGIKYTYLSDTCYCFNNGNFEEMKCDEDGIWNTTSSPYTIIKEGAYLVAKINKGTFFDKFYIFCADKKHLIIYDTNKDMIIDMTEKTGHRDEAWILSGLEYESTSYLSETLRGKNIDYIPENLAIHKLTSSWVEGVEGFGRGEKISFKNRPLNGSRRIYVINGFFSPEKPSLFYDNNRVKTLNINCYKDGALIKSEYRELKDTGEMQVLEFSERYTSFDFIIEDVYPGKKYNDTALTGIFVDALDVYEE